MDPHTKPTPPSGMLAVTADDGRSQPEAAILTALSEMREESRLRGQETKERFDKLDRKVDSLTQDDEALRLDYRRLEQRQAASDEEFRVFRTESRTEARELREELRKEREERDRGAVSVAATFEAMKSHVEVASSAMGAAVGRLDDATARFDAASVKHAADNQAQDDRIGTLEVRFGGVEKKVDIVLDELGVEAPQDDAQAPDPEKAKQPGKLTKIAEETGELAQKTKGTRNVTWLAVAFMALSFLYELVKFLDKVVGGPPLLPP